MPQTFTWSCTHQFTRASLPDAPAVAFPFKCYICTCFTKISAITNACGARIDALESETDAAVISTESHKAFDWQEMEMEKTICEYVLEAREAHGEAIMGALMGVGHDEMLHGLEDEDGAKAMFIDAEEEPEKEQPEAEKPEAGQPEADA